MISFELVGPAVVRAMSCPRCGRGMPLDEAGMVAAQAAWGWCGAVATEADQRVGLLLMAAGAPTDPRVTMARIGAAWMAEPYTGRGHGRALLQTLLGGLSRAKVATVLAGSEPNRGCAALPAGFLAATGFLPIATSTWRLDLATAVPATKRSALDQLGRLVQAVRPVAPPEPARRLPIR